MIVNEYYEKSSNGKNNIFIREYIPEGVPHCILQIAHGICENIDRYDDIAGYFASRGILVVLNDHLGHGRSVGAVEDIGFFAESSGWGMAVADIRKIYVNTSEKYPGLPYFMLGFSMGSLMVRNYVIRYRTGLSGILLSGTANYTPAVLKAGIALADAEIARHGPKYRSKIINAVCLGNVGRFASRFLNLSNSPNKDGAEQLAHHSTAFGRMIPTISMVRDLLRGIEYIANPRNVALMDKNLPVLFVSGSEDPFGEHGRGVVRAYKLFIEANIRSVTLKLYNGEKHEILQHDIRNTVLYDMLSWVESNADEKELISHR